MADILIRGMEMPKSCFDCIFENRFFGKIGCNNLPGMFANELNAIAYTTERNPFCPLLPLPEGHGRLIDAERFRVILCRLKERQNDDVAIHALNWAIECLDKLDTIVPAEGGEADGN